MKDSLKYLLIFFLFSCGSTLELTEYEKHQVAYEAYLDKSDIRGIPYEQLHEMWRVVYMETMLNTLHPTTNN